MGERIAITARAHRMAKPVSGANETQRRVEALQGFDATGFGSPVGAQIWKTPEEAEDDPALRILGHHGRLFDALARDVHAAAGLAALPRERVGLFAGMGMVDSPSGDLLAAARAARGEKAVDWAEFYASAYRSIHPLWPLSMLSNVAVGQVAIDLDIRGDNVVLASDADAGLRALLEAARSVRDGSCDAALAGGVSGRIGPAALARLHFQGRSGVPLGEGGAAFVFERESFARERGATIHGFLLGGATAFGAADEHAGPNSGAVARAIRGALAEADKALEDMGVVHFHREQEDPLSHAFAAELLGFDEVGFSGGGATCASKLHLGHLGAGSPASDVYAALMFMTSADPFPEGMRPDLGDHALIIACGAEGGAGALVLGRSP